MSDTLPQYRAVPTPAETTAALLATCIALKENVDTLTRMRGTSASWAATVQELASETGNMGSPAVSVTYLQGLVAQATNLVGSVSRQMSGKLDKSGGQMGGPLLLAGDATQPDHAVRKAQLDRVSKTAWSEIPNRPEAFPPKPHLHEQDDIINLSLTLAGKADLVHDTPWNTIKPPEGVTPVEGHVLTWTPEGVSLAAPRGGGGGAGLWIGPNPPLVPAIHPFWFDENQGTLLIHFNDGTSQQWVPTAPQLRGEPGPRGAATLNGDRAPTAADGEDDDFWINYATWVIYGPKLNGRWPIGVSMRTGGRALAMSGERVQMMGYNLEMS